MGNGQTIIQSPTPHPLPRYQEETYVQLLQNAYFDEYKTWCSQNIEEAEKESAKWDQVDATIRNMSLVEQSSYADFVTRKMCFNHPDVFGTYSNKTLRDMRSLGSSIKYQGSCAIGNMALIILTLPEGETRNQAAKDFKHFLFN